MMLPTRDPALITRTVKSTEISIERAEWFAESPGSAWHCGHNRNGHFKVSNRQPASDLVVTLELGEGGRIQYTTFKASHMHQLSGVQQSLGSVIDWSALKD